MEKIQIFDNLSQAAEIANREGKLALQDSLGLYQTLTELVKILELGDVLKERADKLIAEQEKAAKVKPTKKV